MTNLLEKKSSLNLARFEISANEHRIILQFKFYNSNLVKLRLCIIVCLPKSKLSFCGVKCCSLIFRFAPRG